MPTNPNMVAIQTVTVGAGGASSIDFQNIPATYTDLVLRVSARSTSSATALDISFNGSTASFTNRFLQGSGSAATSGTLARYAGLVTGSDQTASTFSNCEIYIPNYTGSTNKSFSGDAVQENNATSSFAGFVANLWSNTAAINQITLSNATGNFAQHSTATLYGVTSAGYGAKATGGAIYQDADYFYHVFSSSGTFTPTQSISADVLVIAGGGAGGWDTAGGGGAGGVLLHSSQSLTATNYTVTVGGGGAARTVSAGFGGDGSNSQFASLTASVGGGGGAPADNVGRNGGSGGGGGGNAANAGGTATSGQGFAGGSGASGVNGGGGGGAGEAGNTDGQAFGGDGTNAYASWALATGTGRDNGYYAGGGTGFIFGSPQGGLGGGGTKSGVENGVANTGSGGAAYSGLVAASGAGGSGIVIVRYAK